MSLMDQIQRAWDSAVIAVNGHHSYENIPAPSLAQEFFKRLNQIHSSSIELIVATLWSGYSSIKPSYNGLKIDCDKLKEERNELKTENMTIIAKGTKAISECQQDYDIAVKEMYKHADKIEDLESALNTSRFFIFMSGMCGFVLGLACVYFVV